MNIHIPRGIVANSKDTILLSVNFFNGSEQSKLEYRIKGQTEWKTMTKVDKPDPYYLKIREKWNNIKKLKLKELWEADSSLAHQKFPGSPMPKPNISTHLWEDNIGSQWPEGRHIIEVRAHDRYGRTFTAYQTMRITASDTLY